MSDRPSKSAQKRQAQQVRAMVDELLGLSPQLVRRIVDDEAVMRAIDAARSMNSHGALRRQKQFVARLMRELDVTSIQRELATLSAGKRADRQLFHRAEQARDALLARSTSAHEVLTQFNIVGTDDIDAALAQLSRAHNESTRKSAGRVLFRALMSSLNAGEQT
ncbi:MAG: ribosome biogenesis factor YjgA [Pseudomonadota bacterium]